MNEREELEALRRLAQLEAKAKTSPAAPMEKPDAAKGSYNLNFAGLDTGIPLPENVGNFLAGAGQNIKGLATGAGQYLGLTSREDVAEQRKLDASLDDRWAGKAGNLLSNIPLALIPGAGTARGATLIGAGVGALRPSVSGTETVGNILLEGAGGYVGQKAGNKLAEIIAGRRSVSPVARSTATQSVNVGPSSASAGATVNAAPSVSVRSNPNAPIPMGDDVSAGLTEGQREIIRRARAQGFRTTPGQESGSRVLQQVESKLESQPISSGPFFAIKDNNQRLLNRRWAAAIGEQADELSPAVLDSAYTRMAGVFDSVADDIPRAVNPDDFLARLAQVEANNEGLIDGALLDRSLVRRYFTLAAGGQPTGAQLNNLQSQIGKAAQNARMSDPAEAAALREVQHLILDDIGNGLAPEAREAFNQARQQYRFFSLLADKPQHVNPATGHVSGANLANTLQRTDRTGYALGRNQSELYDATRFAKALPAVVGNSGTATRSPLNALELAASVPMSVATHAYTSSPSIAVTNALTNTLENGLRPGSMSPTNANALRRLLGAAGGAAGVGMSPLVFGNTAQ
jgi:hypothetical protein